MTEAELRAAVLRIQAHQGPEPDTALLSFGGAMALLYEGARFVDETGAPLAPLPAAIAAVKLSCDWELTQRRLRWCVHCDKRPGSLLDALAWTPCRLHRPHWVPDERYRMRVFHSDYAE